MDTNITKDRRSICYEDAHKTRTLDDIDEAPETQPLKSGSTERNEQLVRSGLVTDGKDTLPKEVGSSSNKNVFARMPLIKLWLVLILTFGFAIVLLVASHLTHSLTLRVEAYHALYNLMALAGCLFTIKICERPASIKNTFGWARIELLSCLCTLLFIASLCFSVGLESIQTAAHAGHQDPMHHPLPVIALGGLGLCLNAVVFCLIGGYTHHQGCFLEHRSSGVWVQSRVSEEAVQAGMRAFLGHPFKHEEPMNRSYEGLRGIIRDICGLVVVMICAAVVQWDTRATLALYVDPGFAMISASILLFLSYPFGKECCQILLQTIPGNIDVHAFSAKLLQEFPEIVNVHHLHIWSLSPGKVVATAHIVYTNPKIYRSSINALEQFFMDKDITQVTLQPEFVHYASTLPSEVGSNECLLRCINNLCREKECCMNCLKSKKEENDILEVISSASSSNINRQEDNNTSQEKSICNDQFGSTTNINVTVHLPMKKGFSRLSKSAEELSEIREKVLSTSRSYSCNLELLGKESL